MRSRKLKQLIDIIDYYDSYIPIYRFLKVRSNRSGITVIIIREIYNA